jgi:hypothetical protein
MAGGAKKKAAAAKAKEKLLLSPVAATSQARNELDSVFEEPDQPAPDVESKGSPAQPTTQAVSQQESDEFFDLYDTDGSGAVDIDELVQMVAAFKQRDSSTMNRSKIQEAWDADGDGSVRLLT